MEWGKVRDNSLRMMRSRGYSALEDTSDAMDYVVASEHGRVLVCFGNEVAKFGLKDLRLLGERMQALGVERVVLVVEGSVTPPCKAMVESMAKEGKLVELFRRDELMFDLMQHSLVPPHALLSAQEKEELLRRFQASALPRMSGSDPVARYMGLRRGDVVRIRRCSPSGGFHDFHRLVA